MGKEFEIRREVVLPATPEAVWEAVATGPGTASWLFPEDPGPDAKVESDHPRRFAVRTEGPDGFNAIEFVIEGRDGGTTLLRYVHSGVIAEENWNDQFDAVDGHTDFYLHTLGQYLEHFNGRSVTYVGQPSDGISGPASAGGPEAMDTLREALGISSGAAVGDAVHAHLGAAGTLDGVIDYLTPEFIGIREPDGLWRFFGRNHYGGVVGMSAHIFRDDVDAAASEAVLKAWLDDVYAAVRQS